MTTPTTPQMETRPMTIHTDPTATYHLTWHAPDHQSDLPMGDFASIADARRGVHAALAWLLDQTGDQAEIDDILAGTWIIVGPDDPDTGFRSHDYTRIDDADIWPGTAVRYGDSSRRVIEYVWRGTGDVDGERRLVALATDDDGRDMALAVIDGEAVDLLGGPPTRDWCCPDDLRERIDAALRGERIDR